jgi:hypothetical protein
MFMMDRDRVSSWFLIILIIIGVLIIIFVLVLSNFFLTVLKSTELSPLDDNLSIKNTVDCSDSDGGIIFGEIGEIIFKQKIFFWGREVKVSDYCKGNELVEYYCSDGGMIKGVVVCNYGCGKGKCLG